jgi:hypothetical protein
MEAAEETSPGTVTDDFPQRQLSELFGSYRAEWLREHIFDLYTSPVYFPELTTGRSCLLVGGRGTGKTTALRALSWEGQDRLNPTSPESWEFYGVYYRADTNRVTAFQGPELRDDKWIELFAHYFNLLLTERLLAFTDWYENKTNSQVILPPRACENIAISLNLGNVHTVHDLSDQIKSARLRFEAYINNVADERPPPLSLQGAPVALLVEELTVFPAFKDKLFFFIIDEYENFLDQQQRVVNTLLKHASSAYSFKIGVRELGFRQRTTLNTHEQLRSPADYVRIDINSKLEGVFTDFAAQICDDRISKLNIPTAKKSLTSVRELFPALSEDDEAVMLGISRQVNEIRGQLDVMAPEIELRPFDELPALYQYLIGFWSRAQVIPLDDTYRDFLHRRSEWDTRYGNYKHALLYTLRRHRRGVHKYYAGWDTFAYVAGTNIRFYLQLVEQSLLLHFNKGESLASPVSPMTQTKAAQAVARANLSELEGLSVFGMYLSRLVLGIGRVFQVMAEQLEGHAPEQNQFYLVDDTSDSRRRRLVPSDSPSEVDVLLKEAVMHLALERFPGTKPTQAGDTEEYDYMLHPVFSPLFAVSYRRKRKVSIGKLQLLGLVRSPRITIREILEGSNRALDVDADSDRALDFDEELPEQLALFEAFYEGGDVEIR